MVRVAGYLPLSCLIVIFFELLEHASFYGINPTFQNFAEFNATQHYLNDKIPYGALGLGSAKASAFNSIFHLISYGTPLISAYFVDQHYGPYKVMLMFGLIYALGLICLTIAAIPESYLENGAPVFNPSTYITFFLSLIILAFGSGGVQPTVIVMFANQIPKEDIVVIRDGKEVIIDAEMTIQAAFNWDCFALNIGTLLGHIVCTRVLEPQGFWKVYFFGTITFIIAFTIFLSCYGLYEQKVQNEDNNGIYSKAIRCIAYALSKKNQSDLTLLNNLPPNTSFKFLEYAKSQDHSKKYEERSNKPDERRSSSELLLLSNGDLTEQTLQSNQTARPMKSNSILDWDDEFPNQLRKALSACSVFPLLMFFWIAYEQETTNLVSQAAEMRIPTWLTNDLIPVINPLCVITMIPIIELYLYPYLVRNGVAFGHVKRITVGLFLGAIAMIYAAVLQTMIYADTSFNEAISSPSKISVYWQIPIHILLSLAEIFVDVGSSEYAYSNAPESMKGIVTALLFFPAAAAAGLLIFITPFCKDRSYIYVYYGCGIGCLIACGLTWHFFGHFDNDDDKSFDEQQVYSPLKYTAMNEGKV